MRGIEHEIVRGSARRRIGLLPWSPLGRGWLTGKYRRDVHPSGPTRLGEDPGARHGGVEKRNARERTWQVIDAVTGIADAHGVSPSQIGSPGFGAQPGVTSVILGARSIEQLRDHGRGVARPERG